jgi:hypothetical protein
MGMLDLRSDGRHRASALPWRCFPVAASCSNTRIPPLMRPYPSRQRNTSHAPPPPPYRENIREYSVANKHIGLAEREILVLVYGYFDFQNSP